MRSDVAMYRKMIEIASMNRTLPDYGMLREASPTLRMLWGLWKVVRSRMEIKLFSNLEEMVSTACCEVDGNGINWYDVWLARVYSISFDKDGSIKEYDRKLRIVKGCSKLARYLLQVKTKPLLACVRIEYGNDGFVPIRILYLVWLSELIPRDRVDEIVDVIEWEIQTYTD
jgi:hypothetical protein